MGYALFTARKALLTSRMNTCNANLTLNSERTNVLSNLIFVTESKAAKKHVDLTTQAYANYEAKVSDLKAQYGDDSDKINLEIKDADAALQEALNLADIEQMMSNMTIKKLNMKSNNYDQERQTLQTQLNAFQNELTNVEKAEETGIKNSVAKF